MKIKLFLTGLFLPLAALSQVDYTKYVNPFIGTGGHGHTWPGATLPFGMVQLSPDTRTDQSWDGCGGYHFNDTLIYGFSHTHLSGTGVSDFGDILLMPVSGKVDPPELMGRNFRSAYSHDREEASPGFYAVHLEEGDVDVQLTSTLRSGFHRYQFNRKEKDASLVLDLVHRDKLLNGLVYKISNTRVAGYRQSEGWAKNQVVYFVMDFSQPFGEALTFGGPAFQTAEPVSGSLTRISFRFRNNGPIYVKVALSPVSTDGAIRNLETENPGWDFEQVRKRAREAWQEELGRIQVSGGSEEQKRIFYTALYHCLVVPNIAMDTDSLYRGRDDQWHQATGYAYYSVFSLWDTFRAWHPLMTILKRKETNDFIRTFLAQYEQGGLLPVWELASNETECMIGYHAVSVMADAAVKGIGDFDREEALQAMMKSARSAKRFGLGSYINQGFIAVEDEAESVSRTLEYAYDDWCIAQMAKITGHAAEEREFRLRSGNWQNLLDPETQFMRPRRNGNWYAPFEPREVNNHFTEANAWQYTFFVPHDIPGFIRRMGGPEAFEKKLDELFTASSLTTGREQADITGLVGQYAHGNEPSHHIAYLYNETGLPWKAQRRLYQIMQDMYKDAPDGLIGNEDCGQMSAWYVLSAMGFYQVTPGSPYFQTGIPLFSSVKVHLENGKVFTILRDSLVIPNHYPAAFMDGKTVTKFRYGDILAGKTLEFKNTLIPQKRLETEPADTIENFMIVPVIEAEEVFKEYTTVTLRAFNQGAGLFYTTGDWSVTPFKAYEGPFKVDSTVTIQAFARDAMGRKSLMAHATLHKMPHPGWKIELKSAYKSEYHGGGPEGLMDGIHGDESWRKGYWQGYWGKDFEAVIDLGSEQNVDTVAAGFLQDTRAWILMPKQMSVSCSVDGKTFGDETTVVNTIPDTDVNVQVKKFKVGFSKIVNARYVRIRAANYGKLPSWHPGAGGDAYIFTDEIEIY